MLGYFRLFLALCVVASHLNFFVLRLHQGWGAVFIFYILAGAVTIKLYERVFAFNLKSFMVDRFLRIYPMFLFWVVTSAIILLCYCPQEITLTLKNITQTVLLIPLNFINPQIVNNTNETFIWPPYFSLALELQAYLLLATLISLDTKYNKNNLRFMAIVSFLIYVTVSLTGPFHKQANIDYTYSRLIAVFFLFYIGTLLYKNKKREFSIWYLAILALFVTQVLTHGSYGSTPSTTFYLVTLMPILYSLYYKPKKVFGNKLAGSFSFIIYCNHFLFIYLYKVNHNLAGTSDIKFSVTLFATIICLSVATGIVSYFLIERPLNKIRIRKEV